MADGAAGAGGDPGFFKYWFAHTQSEFGTRLTMLAWPLIAIQTVHASPLQIGILAALENVPYFLFALAVGVWADRVRKKPLMVAADVARALALLVVPVAWLRGSLTLELLYVVAFTLGTLSVVFDVASGAYLPVLVGRARLISANGKLSTSSSAAATVGPGIAGVIIQFLGGVFALAFDAVSYVVSAVLLGTIRCREVVQHHEHPPFRRELFSGIRYVYHDVILRAIAGRLMAWHLVVGVIETLFVLYASTVLRLSSGAIGLLFSLMGLGVFAGSVAAVYIQRRLSAGAAIVHSVFFAALASLLIPLASGWSALFVLGTAVFLHGFCMIVYQINNVSLRQMVTPDRMLGKMNSSVRFLTLGIRPLAALAAGYCGERAGIRVTIAAAGAAGLLLATAGLLFSPLRGLSGVPAPPAA